MAESSIPTSHRQRERQPSLWVDCVHHASSSRAWMMRRHERPHVLTLAAQSFRRLRSPSPNKDRRLGARPWRRRLKKTGTCSHSATTRARSKPERSRPAFSARRGSRPCAAGTSFGTTPPASSPPSTRPAASTTCPSAPSLIVRGAPVCTAGVGPVCECRKAGSARMGIVPPRFRPGLALHRQLRT